MSAAYSQHLAHNGSPLSLNTLASMPDVLSTSKPPSPRIVLQPIPQNHLDSLTFSKSSYDNSMIFKGRQQ